MADTLGSATRKIGVYTLNDGQSVSLCALGLADFSAARERALELYKRDRIKTWTKNADLIPESERNDWIRDAFSRAEAITMEDLPEMEMTIPRIDSNGRPIIGRDGKPLTMRAKVEFTAWWMAETVEGRLFMTWLSMRRAPGQEHFTLDDADAMFVDALEDLENAAQKVGELSEPKLSKKNAEEAPLGRRERRKRRARRRR